MTVDIDWNEAIAYVVEQGYGQEDAEQAAQLLLDAGMGAGQLLHVANVAPETLTGYVSGVLDLSASMPGTV